MCALISGSSLLIWPDCRNPMREYLVSDVCQFLQFIIDHALTGLFPPLLFQMKSSPTCVTYHRVGLELSTASAGSRDSFPKKLDMGITSQNSFTNLVLRQKHVLICPKRESSTTITHVNTIDRQQQTICRRFETLVPLEVAWGETWLALRARAQRG